MTKARIITNQTLHYPCSLSTLESQSIRPLCSFASRHSTFVAITFSRPSPYYCYPTFFSNPISFNPCSSPSTSVFNSIFLISITTHLLHGSFTPPLYVVHHQHLCFLRKNLHVCDNVYCYEKKPICDMHTINECIH